MLKTVAAIRRYHNSTKLGMWVNIHLNAPKILKEESLGRLLVNKGLNTSNLCPESNAEFVNYVLEDVHSPIIHYLGGWPVYQKGLDSSMVIEKLERLRLQRYKTAIELLRRLNLYKEYHESTANETLFVLVSEWTQFESSPLEQLEMSLIVYKRERSFQKYFKQLQQILPNTNVQTLFFSKSDCQFFMKSEIFKLLCYSSVKFQLLYKYEKGYLQDVVRDIGQIIQKYVKNDISREAVLSVFNALGWD